MSRLILLPTTPSQRRPISRFLVDQALGATPWQAKLAALEARLVDDSEDREGAFHDGE